MHIWCGWHVFSLVRHGYVIFCMVCGEPMWRPALLVPWGLTAQQERQRAEDPVGEIPQTGVVNDTDRNREK